ncbi:MAG TPA: hypothetical protein VIH99_02350 [Bdellovibrionota bacterium]|jgi:hypothetical protein
MASLSLFVGLLVSFPSFAGIPEDPAEFQCKLVRTAIVCAAECPEDPTRLSCVVRCTQAKLAPQKVSAKEIINARCQLK